MISDHEYVGLQKNDFLCWNTVFTISIKYIANELILLARHVQKNKR